MLMRNQSILLIAAVVCILCTGIVPNAYGQGDLYINNATIITGTGETINNGSILIRSGKIARIGTGFSVPAGVRVIDAAGLYAMPGIIDHHSHIAANGLNEATSQNSAMVDASDVIQHDSYSIYASLTGGTTTIHVLHGSANNIGGKDEVLKLKWGQPWEAMIVPDKMEGVKFALGENPIRRETRYPNSRMGQEFQIRSYLMQGLDYKAKWDMYEAKLTGDRPPANEYERINGPVPPRKDLRLETVKGVLEGTIRVHSHGYSNSELSMLLRLLKEFGIAPHSLEHAHEAYMLADEIAEAETVVSMFIDFWNYKVESSQGSFFAASLLTERGVKVALNSDDVGSAERARRLNLEAAKSMRYGDAMTETEAIKAITYNPAYGLKLHNRIGTLEVGKDGDVGLWDGHPLSVYSKCVKTIIEGDVYFDRDTALTTEKWLKGEKPDWKAMGGGQ